MKPPVVPDDGGRGRALVTVKRETEASLRLGRSTGGGLDIVGGEHRFAK